MTSKQNVMRYHMEGALARSVLAVFLQQVRVGLQPLAPVQKLKKISAIIPSFLPSSFISSPAVRSRGPSFFHKEVAMVCSLTFQVPVVRKSEGLG
jgi:hypothetical protein